MATANAKAKPIINKMAQINEERSKVKENIADVKERIQKAQQNPKKLKELEDIKAKLEQKKVSIELKYETNLKDAKPVFGSLRDKCNAMAADKDVSNERLKSSCGFWGTPSRQRDDMFNRGIVEPVELPAWRTEGGKMTDWNYGNVHPKWKKDPPIQTGVGEGEGVPPIGPAGPVPGQE